MPVLSFSLSVDCLPLCPSIHRLIPLGKKALLRMRLTSFISSISQQPRYLDWTGEIDPKHPRTIARIGALLEAGERALRRRRRGRSGRQSSIRFCECAYPIEVSSFASSRHLRSCFE